MNRGYGAEENTGYYINADSHANRSPCFSTESPLERDSSFGRYPRSIKSEVVFSSLSLLVLVFRRQR